MPVFNIMDLWDDRKGLRLRVPSRSTGLIQLKGGELMESVTKSRLPVRIWVASGYMLGYLSSK